MDLIVTTIMLAVSKRCIFGSKCGTGKPCFCCFSTINWLGPGAGLDLVGRYSEVCFILAPLCFSSSANPLSLAAVHSWLHQGEKSSWSWWQLGKELSSSPMAAPHFFTAEKQPLEFQPCVCCQMCRFEREQFGTKAC